MSECCTIDNGDKRKINYYIPFLLIPLAVLIYIFLEQGVDFFVYGIFQLDKSSHLTVIIDLYDRKVIGWAFSRSLKAAFTTIPAWRMAIRNRPITQVLIFHSDRGVQFACNEFKNILESYKLVERSMSRKGNCWDNAVAESFFKTLKVEHIYQNSYKTFREAELSVFEYIEAWYNVNRIHTTIKTSIKNKKEIIINQLVA